MKQKIAVLGGGMGSLSAVLALTSTPGWQERYEITVYQYGWRLGGKGASGRNRKLGHRIEEHGFHIWMGFYHNAFRTMREVYEERLRVVADPGIFRRWEDAWTPQRLNVLTEHIGGHYKPWPITYDDKPGDPSSDPEAQTPWEHVTAILHWLRGRVQEIPGAIGRARAAAEHPLDLLHRLAERVATPLHMLEDLGKLGALELAAHLAGALSADVSAHTEQDHAMLVQFLDHERDRLTADAEGLVDGSDEFRHLLIGLEFGLALLRGVLADRVMFRGWEVLDDEEFRAWLGRHGATSLLLESETVKSLYDAGFDYADGQKDTPDMAAGAAAQSILRIFLRQRGPFSWKMLSGMGDCVFAPIYQVLAARGVRFEFFSDVKRLAYDAASNSVSSIDVLKQVTLVAPYEPLIRVEGVDAWPSAPKYDLVENGAELEAAIESGAINLESRWSPPWKDATLTTLTHGVDYDIVILGISIAAQPEICQEIGAAKPALVDMWREVRTVVTQAQQIWFTPTLAELGWTYAPSVVQGYPAHLGQWLDATHAIAREKWEAGQVPGALVYFCDTIKGCDLPPPASDIGYPARAVDENKQKSREWLEQYTGLMWPKATVPGTLSIDYALVADPQGRSGADRLDGQYWRVNVEPSERYVLSLTGSTKYRLATDQSGVDGLFLTGDWIRNGWNVGCVESTVMSGLQCARAISGDAIEITDEHFFRWKP